MIDGMHSANDPNKFEEFISKTKSGNFRRNIDVENNAHNQDSAQISNILDLLKSQELRSRDVAKNIRFITTVYAVAVIGSILFLLIFIMSMFVK